MNIRKSWEIGQGPFIYTHLTNEVSLVDTGWSILSSSRKWSWSWRIHPTRFWFRHRLVWLSSIGLYTPQCVPLDSLCRHVPRSRIWLHYVPCERCILHLSQRRLHHISRISSLCWLLLGSIVCICLVLRYHHIPAPHGTHGALDGWFQVGFRKRTTMFNRPWLWNCSQCYPQHWNSSNAPYVC